MTIKKFKKKSDFYKNKKVIKIDDIDVNKILVSNKEPYGTNKSIKNILLDIMMMSLDPYV